MPRAPVTVIGQKKKSPLRQASAVIQEHLSRKAAAKQKLDDQKALLKFQQDQKRIRQEARQEKLDTYIDAKKHISTIVPKRREAWAQKQQEKVASLKQDLLESDISPESTYAMTLKEKQAFENTEARNEIFEQQNMFTNEAHTKTSSTFSKETPIIVKDIPKFREATAKQTAKAKEADIKTTAFVAQAVNMHGPDFTAKYKDIDPNTRTILNNYRLADEDPQTSTEPFITESLTRDFGLKSGPKIQAAKLLLIDASTELRRDFVKAKFYLNKPLNYTVTEVNSAIMDAALKVGGAPLDVELDPKTTKGKKFKEDVLNLAEKNLRVSDRKISPRQENAAISFLTKPINASGFHFGSADSSAQKLGREKYIRAVADTIPTDEAGRIYDEQTKKFLDNQILR